MPPGWSSSGCARTSRTGIPAETRRRASRHRCNSPGLLPHSRMRPTADAAHSSTRVSGAPGSGKHAGSNRRLPGPQARVPARRGRRLRRRHALRHVVRRLQPVGWLDPLRRVVGRVGGRPASGGLVLDTRPRRPHRPYARRSGVSEGLRDPGVQRPRRRAGGLPARRRRRVDARDGAGAPRPGDVPDSAVRRSVAGPKSGDRHRQRVVLELAALPSDAVRQRGLDPRRPDPGPAPPADSRLASSTSC